MPVLSSKNHTELIANRLQLYWYQQNQEKAQFYQFSSSTEVYHLLSIWTDIYLSIWELKPAATIISPQQPINTNKTIPVHLMASTGGLGLHSISLL